MSVVNKFVNFMSLNSDSEQDDYFDDDFEVKDDYKEERSIPEPFEKETESERDYEPAARPTKRYGSSNKVAPMKSRRGNSSMNLGSGLEVCVIKPVSIDDARAVTETLLNERAVVLNLEGLDVEIAQRIIDFTSGSCYAISGNLQKISNYIFIITPQSVEISGDFQDIFGGGNSEVSTI